MLLGQQQKTETATQLHRHLRHLRNHLGETVKRRLLLEGLLEVGVTVWQTKPQHHHCRQSPNR